MVVERSLDVLVVGVVVLAANGVGLDRVLRRERGGHRVVGRKGVGGAEGNVGAARFEGQHQVGGLTRHVEAGRELEALERLLLREARANKSQNGHLALRPVDEVLALRGKVQVFDVTAFGADFQVCCPLLVHNFADHFDVGKALSSAQGLELDQDLDADDIAAEFANQPDRGGRRAARRQYIIDDQHLLAGFDCIRMHLELGGAVLELVGVTDRLPRQLSGLAEGDEAGVYLDSDRGAGDESAGLDGGDQVGLDLDPLLRHQIDDLAKELLAGEQWRDVAKDDAGLREVGNVADVLLQRLGGRHTTERKYSRVRLNASSRPTSGSQPSSCFAWVMSGRLCFGSSTGSSLWTILLLDFASRTMVCASCRTVTS